VAPTSLNEFQLLPGVPEAVAQLKTAGFLVIVVTNQPDVATGRTARSVVEAMHAEIAHRMPVDDIRACYHIDADQCACRKPKPGLIVEAAVQFDIDLGTSYVVGDRWRDIEAGRAAGCLTIFVDYGYEQEEPNRPDMVVQSLPEAVTRILYTRNAGSKLKREHAMTNPAVDQLKIKIYADGADLKSMREAAANPLIKGFTTNPTLMRQAGVRDYRGFALDVLKTIPDRSVSFEVFADDFPTMEQQAREIASWGRNVYVKIPISNTKGEFAGPLISKLAQAGVQLNITAIMTPAQVARVADALAPKVPAIVSVFAGRVADTGRDPVPLMAECLRQLESRPRAELLWASPRELLNIFQADEIGCHIITITPDHLKKLSLVGKNLDEYSCETVAMFHKDAVAASFEIPVSASKVA
jgi:transaldolase